MLHHKKKIIPGVYKFNHAVVTLRGICYIIIVANQIKFRCV